MEAEGTAVTAGQNALPSRPVRLIRVSVLALVGIVVAFSAPLHPQLGFDVAIATVAIAALGIAHAVEWISMRASGGSPIPLLLSIIAFVTAVVLSLSVATALAFAMTIAAWALASALLEFIGATTRPGTRQDATLLGGLGVLLAALVLVVREDQVAILGFLGAYAIVAGVFLGISAFDSSRKTSNRLERPTSASRA